RAHGRDDLTPSLAPCPSSRATAVIARARGPPSLESSGYGCGRRQSGATPSGPPQQAPVRPRESAGWGQAALPVAVSLPGPEQDVTDRRFRAFHSSTRVVAARILTRETATATARPPT